MNPCINERISFQCIVCSNALHDAHFGFLGPQAAHPPRNECKMHIRTIYSIVLLLLSPCELDMVDGGQRNEQNEPIRCARRKKKIKTK